MPLLEHIMTQLLGLSSILVINMMKVIIMIRASPWGCIHVHVVMRAPRPLQYVYVRMTFSVRKL